MKYLIATVCILTGLSLSACAEKEKTTMDDVKEDTQALLHTLKNYSADQRDEALEKSEDALEKMDKRIEELEERIDANWDKMSESARTKTKQNLETLREQRKEVAKWYGNMKNSSANAWKDIQGGFSKAYESVSDAWEKAENQFEKDKDNN